MNYFDTCNFNFLLNKKLKNKLLGNVINYKSSIIQYEQHKSWL